MVSEAWRNLSPDEREVYENMSIKDKARYNVEKTMYKGAWTVPIGYKRPKDTTAPKRPVPAFFAFSNKRRAMAKAQIPGASNAELSKALSQMWKDAPNVLREQYKHEEAELGRKYKVDIAEWRRKEDETMKRRQEEIATRITESDGGDAAYNDAARDVLLLEEQHSNVVPGAFNLRAFQTQQQYQPLSVNHQQGTSSLPQLLHTSPVIVIAAAQQHTSTPAPYYHQGWVEGAPAAAWNQHQLSLLANSASASAAVVSAAGQQTRMMVAGNESDSTALGPYAGHTTTFPSSNRQLIQEHQARLMDLIVATRRGQNQHPARHQHDYQQHHHQTIRHTEPSSRVGGTSAGIMQQPDDHQYYHHTSVGGQAAATYAVSLRRNDNDTNRGSGTYNMDHAGDTHRGGVVVSTPAATVGGGASNSSILLSPGEHAVHHRGTAEGASSLDPGAAEGAYETNDPPGGMAARRTMNDDGHHRQSTTIIHDAAADAAAAAAAADGFTHQRPAATLLPRSADEQEMRLHTNAAVDRQQERGSSSPSSAGFLDSSEWSSDLRRSGGEGGEASYFESTTGGSSLSSIDEF